MNLYNRNRFLTGAVASIFSLALTAGIARAQHAKPAAHLQKRVVTINGGYSPSRLTVKAGQPVQLTFKAGANVGCGDTIVIKDLGITRTLDKKGVAVVAFTPKKSGTLAFTCGMGMYRGQIVVQ